MIHLLSGIEAKYILAVSKNQVATPERGNDAINFIVPTLRRGNAVGNAPALPNATSTLERGNDSWIISIPLNRRWTGCIPRPAS
ncbi:MAG: hypothetical protein QX198_09115 [Methylococcaceae bacterium]